MNSPTMPKFSKDRRTSVHTRKFQTQIKAKQPEILLVDDGSDLFPNIGTMLQNHGFQVILAPDAETALKDVLNYDFAAVIAGASREQSAGLDVLAAVKEKRSEIKTMVVTELLNPELPVQAYEMDIDDYIHWPLSSDELSGRLKGLLDNGRGGGPGDSDLLDLQAQESFALTAMGSIVDGFTNSLAMISQSLEDIRQEHLNGMEESLSAELSGFAVQINKLSDSLRRCWRSGSPTEPVSPAKISRFH
jgi:DNA-binding response OmpR family regulator